MDISPAAVELRHVSLTHAFQLACRRFDEPHLTLQRIGNPRDLVISFPVAPLLNPFTRTGHRLRPVTGFDARRVQQMAVPRPPGQAALVRQLTLALHQPRVDRFHDVRRTGEV